MGVSSLFSESLDNFLEGRESEERDPEQQQVLSLISRYRYGGRGREWHPEFVKYMYKIAKHPNFAGIPWGIDEKGKIRWNAPSHRPPGGKWSNLHDERLEWWRKKAEEDMTSMWVADLG